MLRREAAKWLTRLQSGREADVERKFRRWYDRDPSHAAAFERVRKNYERSGLLRRSPEISTSASQLAPQGRALQPAYALAALLALAALVGTASHYFGGRFGTSATEAIMLSTRVGEIRKVRLADGSNVTLDTSTTVELQIGSARRHAFLRNGRVRFEVARRSVPFVIHAGTATASSGNGVLDVEEAADQSQFALLSGTAELRGPAGARSLAAGDVVTAHDGALSATRLAPDSSNWTRGLLEFDATPLGSAVALANRYSAQKIIIDPGVQELRVTGAFRAGDTAGLAKALAVAFHLALRRSANGGFILARP